MNEVMKPIALSSMAMSNTGLVIMTYGSEGSGKTHLAGTGPAPLFISVGKSTDQGLRSASGNKRGFAFQAFKLEDDTVPQNSLMHILRYIDNLINTGKMTPKDVNPIVLDHLYGVAELVLDRFKSDGLEVILTQAEIIRRQKTLQGYDNSNAVDAIVADTILPLVASWGNKGFIVNIINHEAPLSEKKLAKLGDSNYALFHPWGTYKMSEWFKKNIPVILHTKRTLAPTMELGPDNKPILATIFSVKLGPDMDYYTKTNVLGSYKLPMEITNDFTTLLRVIDEAASMTLGSQAQPNQPAPMQQVPAHLVPVQQAPPVQPVIPAQPVQQVVQPVIPVAPVQGLNFGQAPVDQGTPPVGVLVPGPVVPVVPVQPAVVVAPIQQPVPAPVVTPVQVPQGLNFGQTAQPVAAAAAAPITVPAAQITVPVAPVQVQPTTPVVAPIQPVGTPIVNNAITDAFKGMFPPNGGNQ
jgi:hypothetical protein